eukprot:scaffold140284_cov40-Cyclotella_meneghiniana.AAC.5
MSGRLHSYEPTRYELDKELFEGICYSMTTRSSLRLLESILRLHPDAVNDTYDDPFSGGGGRTMLHLAARHRSPEFCKLIVQARSDLVRVKDERGSLPFHYSCSNRNVDTAKYLFGLYPECINIPDERGFYPLHCFLFISMSDGPELDTRELSKPIIVEFAKFLLQHDQGAISAATNEEEGGDLPLHFACGSYSSGSFGNSFEIITRVFDAYPQAIYVENANSRTPFDGVSSHVSGDVDQLREAHFYYKSQAIVPDRIGQLPIHRAVQDEDVSVGILKLMMAANPNSVNAVDNGGSTPLHIACRVGDIEVVKYLVEVNESALQMRNRRGEFPLQIACDNGKCDVINYILEKSDHGVSTKNWKKRLPIQVLLFDADCDRDSLEFVDAVGRLLSAYPVNPADLAKEEDKHSMSQCTAKEREAKPSALPVAAASAISNPYAKKKPANPYAKKPALTNPYAKIPAPLNPYAKQNNPYTKTYALANPYAKQNNPYAKHNNPYAKHNNPYAKTHASTNSYGKPNNAYVKTSANPYAKTATTVSSTQPTTLRHIPSHPSQPHQLKKLRPKNVLKRKIDFTNFG